jgi:prolyl-tRNA synthetase family I
MKKETKEGLTVKKSENFSKWYTEVIKKSELMDYTDVSGSMVFRPDSFAIWEKVKETFDKKIKKDGVRNVYFPLLIPESLLKKETEHVEGFSPEVAWVTHTGSTKLKEKLAIRPTSETIMYPSYAKWIRSWKDLPLRLNQWNSVVRWEFKNPVPFLRTREFLWQEGHTAFATKKEAEKEVHKILEFYAQIFEDLCAVPVLIGIKSEKEKFAGAEFTLSVEAFLPNGKAIQGATSHHLSQNFSRVFDIKFSDKHEKKDYVYQNSWGLTTRTIGIMVGVHGDDKGLVLPPKVAPNKVVVIPIIFKKDKDKVLKVAKEIKRKLGKYNSVLDDREDYSAGWKFNEWEQKGIPIRIEIGPRDVSKKQVVLVRRDTSDKKIVKISNLDKEIKKTLEDIQNNLFSKAKKLLENSITNVKNITELKKVVNSGKIGKANWCGVKGCEENIKDKTGAKSLNSELNKKGTGMCFACKAKAKYVTYFGKSY